MSRSSITLAVALALSTLVAGCGTRVDYTPLRAARGMAPRSPEQVEVFITQKPSRPYVEVGLLEARQESEYSLDGQSAVIAELREEAAQLGCDGLILTGGANESVGHMSEGTGHVTELKGYRAVCIVWT